MRPSDNRAELIITNVTRQDIKCSVSRNRLAEMASTAYFSVPIIES